MKTVVGSHNRKIAVCLIAMLLFVSMTGCDYLPFGYVSVGELSRNPTQFDGQKIKIKGRVSDVTKLPFMEIRFYALNDNGHQIMVAAEGPVPAANKEIAVIGVVENFAIVGSKGIGLHIREIKRLDHLFY
jgi:hypothetical protein